MIKGLFDKLGLFSDSLSGEEEKFARAYQSFGAERVKDAVWMVYSQETRERYFVKRATPEEVRMTRAASEFDLPEDSNLVLPEMLDADEIFSHISADEFPVPERDAGYTELLVTKGHPLEFLYRDFIPPTFGNIMQEQWKSDDGIPTPLRGQPMTSAELAVLRRDVEALNEAGIFNHDFGSNLFIQREKDGALKFYAIDFEPHVFKATAPEGVYEDVDHIDGFLRHLRQKASALIDDRAGEPIVGHMPEL